MFLSDGKELLSTGSNGVLRFWDAADGRQVRTVRLQGEAGLGNYVTPSPDGKTLVAHSGKELVLWEAASGKEIKRLPWDEQRLSYLYFSPDGRTLVAVNEHGLIVTFWDLERLTHRAIRLDEAAADNGQHQSHLFLAGRPPVRPRIAQLQDPVPRIFDVAGGKELYRLDGSASASAFTPDGNFLVTSSMKGAKTPGKISLIFWDMATGKEDQRLRTRRRGWRIRSIAGLHRGRQDDCLRESGSDSPGGPRRRPRVARHDKGPAMAGFLFARQSYARGAAGLSHPPVGRANGQGTPRPAGRNGRAHAVALSPDGRFAATAEWIDHEVSLWDAATGRRLRLLELKGEGRYVRSLAFTGDGGNVAACQYKGFFQCWDAATGKELRALQPEGSDSIGYPYPRYHISPDGQQICSASDPREQSPAFRLQTWDAQSGKRLREHSCEPFTQFAWGEDGNAAVCRADGVSVVDVTTGRSLAHVPGKWAAPLAVSPDGRLACALADEKSTPRTVHVWEVATGKEVAALEAGAPGKAAFAVGCRCLVTTEPTGLCVWDLATGKLRRRWSVPKESEVRGLCPSADGRRALTPLADGTLLIWDLTSALRAGEPSAPTAAETDLAAWWADLAGTDAAKAYKAVWRMTEAPDLALPFLRKRLTAVSEADFAQLRGPLADLDSDDFVAREKASKALAEMGNAALPALRHALANDPSPEVRRRLEALLADPAARTRAPEDLRRFRAVLILEGIGSKEARGLLAGLAKGMPEVEQTNEAKRALGRLDAQPHVGPP